MPLRTAGVCQHVDVQLSSRATRCELITRSICGPIECPLIGNVKNKVRLTVCVSGEISQDGRQTARGEQVSDVRRRKRVDRCIMSPTKFGGHKRTTGEAGIATTGVFRELDWDCGGNRGLSR